MKMHGMMSPVDLDRMMVPSGTKFPNNPQSGEIFRLTTDQPVTYTADPWYGAGIYIRDYSVWKKLNDSGRERKASIISAQPAIIETVTKTKNLPLVTDGVELAHAILRPSNSKATFSGSASLWVESESDCQVILSVFRGDKIIAMIVEAVKIGAPRNLSITFADMPFTSTGFNDASQIVYHLRLAADKAGMVNVNRGRQQFVFDDVALQTAFLVAENT